MFSYCTSVIFLTFYIHTVMSTKLVCQSTQNDKTFAYGPKFYRTYSCNAVLEKCCPDGCCSILTDIPWYIWAILAMAAIVIFLILCIVIFYLHMFVKVMSIRRRHRTTISRNNRTPTTSNTRKSEPPPTYSVAINLPLLEIRDLEQVPTYEEATARK